MTALDSAVAFWIDWMRQMAWQWPLVFAVGLAADACLKRTAWSRMRYAVWVLVALKLVVPPSVPSPFGLGESIQSSVFPRVGVGDRLGMYDRTAVSIQSMAFAAWLSGVVLFGFLSVRRRAVLTRRLGVNAGPVGSDVRGSAILAARRLGLRRVPLVLMAEAAPGPVVMGVVKPIVYLPPETVRLLTPSSLEHVLMHEFAHVKRGDLVAQMLGECLQVVYWFNPLLVLITRRLHVLREVCCDLTVSRASGVDIRAYQSTLFACARRMMAQPRMRHGLPWFGESSAILTRLRALQLSNPPSMARRTMAIMMVLVVVLILPLGARAPWLEWRAARRTVQEVVDHPERFGSVHVRNAILYLNNLEANARR